MSTRRSFALFRCALTLLAALLVAFASSSAWANAEERQAALDAELAKEIEKQSPDAATAFRAAVEASRRRDEAQALASYEKVNALLPTCTPALRRRAMILVETHKRAEGLALARRAVELEPTPFNELALAHALHGGAPEERGTPAELERALAIVRRLADHAPDDVDFRMAHCQVAISASSGGDLDACAARLMVIAPEEWQSQLFGALAAANRGDLDVARERVRAARRLGGDQTMLDHLTEALDDAEPWPLRWGKRLGIALGLWLVGLALLFAVGAALSSATLRLVRRLAPHRGAEGHGRILRGIYRAVLGFASVYYYASLPLVLVVCTLAGAGVIVGFFYVGRIPVYLVLVVGSAVLFTISSVVKSIFVRIKDEAPGIPVDLKKHPGLARVIEEVASCVGTRAVDEVFLTPSAGISVLERGGFFKVLRGNTQRCLVLGVGVLDGMKLGPFKAVLAHEYGHFSNRDTAGGGMALSVRRSLLHTAFGLAVSGAAAWYNPAWHFVLGFQKIFLRISQGASRLQEVLADRVAAFSYGPEAFARGLEHVVRRSVAFDAHVSATLSEVVERSRPLANLYMYEPEKKVDASELEEGVVKALEEEPSPYDSHPKPADRIRWVRALATTVLPSTDDDAAAWDLFANRLEIEQRMTAEVRSRLAEQGHIVPAEERVEAAA